MPTDFGLSALAAGLASGGGSIELRNNNNTLENNHSLFEQLMSLNKSKNNTPLYLLGSLTLVFSIYLITKK